MKKSKLVAAALFAACAAAALPAAAAAPITTTALLEQCDALPVFLVEKATPSYADTVRARGCMSYLEGTVDAIRFWQNATDVSVVCLPENGVSTLNMVAAIRLHLVRVPSDATEPARTAVPFAFKEAFPCK